MSQLVILAGGKGSRIAALQDSLGSLPKPMFPLANKPILEHQIELGKKYGFTKILLLAGYRAEMIEKHFGDGKKFGVEIKYQIESEPLGTSGALLSALDQLDENFILMYGDTVLNVDLQKFSEFHKKNKAQVSLFVHPNDHPYDSDLIETDAQDHVVGFHSYPHEDGKFLPNLVNAALYVIDREVLKPYAATIEKKDIAKHLFPKMLKDGVRFSAYKTAEYIKDMGTEDRFERVARDYESGKIFDHAPRPGIFLDRDGTVVKYVSYLDTPEQLELAPGIGEAIRNLNIKGYRTALITNQPVIARGQCTVEELKRIHNKLETLLGKERAFLDSIYFCPHHPDKGYPGEIAELKIDCNCRKPKTGMVDRAVKELGIDLSKSWFVGDSTLDVATAKKSGMKSILLRTGQGKREAKYPYRPDFEFNHASEAIAFILKGYPEILERIESLNLKVLPGETILVAGLAASGKSVFASSLADYFKRQGKTSKIVSLDSWIIDKDARKEGMTVRDRFQVDQIEQTFSDLIQKQSAGQTVTLNLPFYDRIIRKSYPQGEKIEISPNDILIIEGVVALDIPVLRSSAEHRLFMSFDEGMRKKRVTQDYLVRGFSAAEAESIYSQRKEEEHPIVLETEKFATRSIAL